nr:DUF3078 domain-containing protein [bacterium]
MREIAIVCLIALTTAVFANAEDWDKSADLGLLFSQSNYSDEWAGSELGAMTWTFNADMVAAKNLSPSTNWKNTMKLSYGQTHQEREGDDGKSWAKPLKSTDRVFAESLLRFGIDHPITPYTALVLESQFHDGDNNILSPTLLAESAGVGRELVKTEETELLTRVGFAARQRSAHGL